jgi:hypothetical protein
MFLPRSDRYEYYLYRKNRRNRRLTFFIAAVLLLLALGARHTAGHHPARAPHPAVTPTARATGATRSAQARPAVAAAGISWLDFHGIELPVSAQDGPRHVADGLAWGFADTQRGALLAAVNITVRTAAQWGPQVYGPTIRYQVTGPDAAALAQADASQYQAMRAASAIRPGQGDAVLTAWRFESWNPAAALVDVATAAPAAGDPGTAGVVTSIRVAWLDGDWRVLAPPGGTWASSAATVSSLSGFTPFPGGR